MTDRKLMKDWLIAFGKALLLVISVCILSLGLVALVYSVNSMIIMAIVILAILVIITRMFRDDVR